MGGIDWNKYGVEVPQETRLITPEEWKQQNQTNSVAQTEKKTEYEKAVESDNFWNLISNNYDRVKADKNQDHRISYEEYREYVLNSEEVSLPEINSHLKTYVYKLDYSFCIVFGMVCIALIIVSWFRRKT